MKTIAVVSTVGGAGRTTLTATLAALLARRGRPVVALDLDPQNLLGAYLGLDTLAQTGIGNALAGEFDVWSAPTWRNGEGVLFAPYGELSVAQRAAAEAELGARPQWLADAVGRLDFPALGVLLVDTPRYPSPQAEQALGCADLVLCVTPPEPAACATLARRLLPALKAAGAQVKIVVNRLNPAREMQRDALAMLRVVAGDAQALTHRVHLDAAMPEAFARGSWLFDDAPHSQASHDLQGLGGWLDTWIDGGRMNGARRAT